MAHELDRVMKMLASKYPAVFMQLLFGHQEGVVLKRVEDTTINIPQKQSDKVFRVVAHGQEAMINFEFMTEPDKRRLRDFHCKSGMLTATFDCEVVTVIIYLDRSRYKTFPDTYQPQIGGICNRNQFEIRRLWDYKERIESGELKGLIPLLVLCEAQPEISLLKQEKELISQIPVQNERNDMIALAMMVAFRKFREEIVRELFKEERNLMKESDFIQEFIKEGREIGREEGWKEGHKEGQKEGQKETQLSIINRLIEKKFGSVPSDVYERIELLDYDQLRNLIFDLIDMKQLIELKNWLTTQPM